MILLHLFVAAAHEVFKISPFMNKCCKRVTMFLNFPSQKLQNQMQFMTCSLATRCFSLREGLKPFVYKRGTPEVHNDAKHYTCATAAGRVKWSI